MDRCEKRQAEFLVKKAVPIDWFTRIGVMNDHAAQLVLGLAEAAGVNVSVQIMPEWYFQER